MSQQQATTFQDIALQRERGLLQRFTGSQAFWVTVAVLVIAGGMMMISDAFARPQNLFNITRNFAFFGIMALGMTVVIITAGIDLSVGSVMGLVGIVTGLLMASGYPIWVGVGAGLLTALAVGFVNGVLIAYFRLSPFVVTLGMLAIARSLALVVSNNRMFWQFGPDHDKLIALGGGQTFGIANPVLILIALTILFGFVLNYTQWGRHVYAIGGNEQAARLSGIDIARTKIAVYAFSGMLAGVAAVLFVAQYRQGKPDAGANGGDRLALPEWSGCPWVAP
jgi:ribose transport system permease protein